VAKINRLGDSSLWVVIVSEHKEFLFRRTVVLQSSGCALCNDVPVALLNLRRQINREIFYPYKETSKQ
jgi:hypothetical protein